MSERDALWLAAKQSSVAALAANHDTPAAQTEDNNSYHGRIFGSDGVAMTACGWLQATQPTAAGPRDQS